MTEKKLTEAEKLSERFCWVVGTASDRSDGYPEGCFEKMNLTYLDDHGWTPITVAIWRKNNWWNSHRPYEAAFEGILRSGRLTFKDLTTKQGDHQSVLEYAIRYPETFERLVNLPICIGKDKEIYTPEFWKIVQDQNTGVKRAYVHCPGFNKEWLLEDLDYLKENKYQSDETIKKAIEVMGDFQYQGENALAGRVKKMIAGAKGFRLEYDCYSHYGHGLFGGPRFYDYDGSNLSSEYFKTLHDWMPNIERLELPCLDKYHYLDFHYTMKNMISDKTFTDIAQFDKLKELDCGYISCMGVSGLKEIAKLKNLEKLSFRDTDLLREGFAEVLKLPNLQELDLDGCGYDKELIKSMTKMLPYEGSWYAPSHPKYLEAKKIEDARIAEIKRKEDLQKSDWKDKFYAFLKAGKKRNAIEVLELNHVFQKRAKTEQSTWKRDRQEDVGPHILTRWGQNEFHVANDLVGLDMLDLGHDNIAIGQIYENRNWRSCVGYSGGIGWYWAAEVSVVNLDKGVGEKANSETICVRDPDSSYRDIFQYIDREKFLSTRNGEVVASLGHYASASVAIPTVVVKSKTQQIPSDVLQKQNG